MDSKDLTRDYGITHGFIGGLKGAGYSDGQVCGILQSIMDRNGRKVALDLGSIGEGLGGLADRGVEFGRKAFTSENVKKYSPYVVAGLGAIAGRELLAPKRKMFGPRGLAAGALGGIAGGYAYNNWDSLAPRIAKFLQTAGAAVGGTARGTPDSPAAARHPGE